MDNLISNDLAELPLLTIPLNIDPKNDSFIIKRGAGVAVAHVKKQSGEVFSIHVRADGAFRQMTHFDPSQLTIADRRRLELELYKKGHTQNDIADLVGVKQPTVARDLKLMRQAKNS